MYRKLILDDFHHKYKVVFHYIYIFSNSSGKEKHFMEYLTTNKNILIRVSEFISKLLGRNVNLINWISRMYTCPEENPVYTCFDVFEVLNWSTCVFSLFHSILLLRMENTLAVIWIIWFSFGAKKICCERSTLYYTGNKSYPRIMHHLMWVLFKWQLYAF